MSRKISLAEVKLHGTDKDCWIIVNDKVYDCQNYLNDHPGGPEVITELAGGDATQEYDDVGHSSEAHEILKKYLVGVVSADAPVPAAAAAVSAKPAAAAPAPTPAPVQRAPAPVAPAQPTIASSNASSGKPLKPVPPPAEEGSDMLLIGGAALAIAGVAFFVWRRSQNA